MTSRSDFLDLVPPLHDRLKLYDPARSPTDQPRNDAADPAKAVPQTFIDAMIVREEVFAKEQHVPLERELDGDDARSFHWVAYASLPETKKAAGAVGDEGAVADHQPRRKSSSSTKIPIGTIRLVPPPHPHATPERESYVKLGRLAVIREFRKAGISRLLIDTALAYVRAHPHSMVPLADPSRMEALSQREYHHHNHHQEGDEGYDRDWGGGGGGGGGGGVAANSTSSKTGSGSGGDLALDFRGLTLVHAQEGVQKLWARYGFETDESMGKWDEEGIVHVGMWKRVNVAEGGAAARKRTSKGFSGSGSGA